MSKNRGFSDTSANRYSLALFELAKEDNLIEEVEKHCLLILKLISENKDFNSFIKDPTNKKLDQIKVITQIFEKFNLNDLLKKFLNFLIIKRRFFYIEKILNNFLETCSKKRGEIKAELIVSKSLTNVEIDNIKEELSKNFNSKIKLNYKNDPSLIGGLIVKIGSTMIDTSIKNKLQQIQNKMIEA